MPTERRHIRPATLRFADAPPWHTERQWLLDAYDLERAGVARTFALSGIRAWAATAEGLPPPLDPALLARLDARYGFPRCGACDRPMFLVTTYDDGMEHWNCPAHPVDHPSYDRWPPNPDILALVRWARGLAGGEGDE